MVFVLHLFSMCCHRGISDPALEEIFVGRALKLGKDCYWKKQERSRSSFTKSVFAVKIFPNIVFWGSQNYPTLAEKELLNARTVISPTSNSARKRRQSFSKQAKTLLKYQKLLYSEHFFQIKKGLLYIIWKRTEFSFLQYFENS